MDETNQTPQSFPTLPPATQPQIEPLSPEVTYTQQPVAKLPTNNLAIVSAVASGLSWLGLFGIGAVVGLILGFMARNEIKSSHGTQGGDGLALTGIILGAANLAFICMMLMCISVIITLAAASGS